jgi:hypothetical protein
MSIESLPVHNYVGGSVDIKKIQLICPGHINSLIFCAAGNEGQGTSK